VARGETRPPRIPLQRQHRYPTEARFCRAPAMFSDLVDSRALMTCARSCLRINNALLRRSCIAATLSQSRTFRLRVLERQCALVFDGDHRHLCWMAPSTVGLGLGVNVERQKGTGPGLLVSHAAAALTRAATSARRTRRLRRQELVQSRITRATKALHLRRKSLSPLSAPG
jgi:hypothetical protein